jgi:hypothetical protein
MTSDASCLFKVSLIPISPLHGTCTYNYGSALPYLRKVQK